MPGNLYTCRAIGRTLSAYYIPKPPSWAKNLMKSISTSRFHNLNALWTIACICLSYFRFMLHITSSIGTVLYQSLSCARISYRYLLIFSVFLPVILFYYNFNDKVYLTENSIERIPGPTTPNYHYRYDAAIDILILLFYKRLIFLKNKYITCLSVSFLANFVHVSNLREILFFASVEHRLFLSIFILRKSTISGRKHSCVLRQLFL